MLLHAGLPSFPAADQSGAECRNAGASRAVAELPRRSTEPLWRRDPNAMAVNREGGRASNRLAREADAEIDRALIQRAQAGDTGAFRELVDRHQRRAFAIAFALGKD